MPSQNFESKHGGRRVLVLNDGAISPRAGGSGVETDVFGSATARALVRSTVAGFLKAAKIGEHSLDLCWQLEGHQSNKSSVCSFQVTGRSENVYMMAVLMGQNSSEKQTHTHTRSYCMYTQEHFSLGKTSGINE